MANKPSYKLFEGLNLVQSVLAIWRVAVKVIGNYT